MTEMVWIDLPGVLAIHAHHLDELGGASGLRDRKLLEATLARPRQGHTYGDPDVFDLAAAYTAAIISNHLFLDGNKRTSFVVGILFSELNGLTFTASEADATQAMLDLALGQMTENQFAAWLRANSTPL